MAAHSLARRGRARRAGWVALGSLTGLLGLRCRRWHLRWGATDEEVAAVLPGDDLLDAARFRATRAITEARTGFRAFHVEEPALLGCRKPDSTWVWRLTPLPGGRTRLVSRLQSEYHLPGALVAAPLLDLGDFPMMRRQLLGIRERAESLTRREP